MKHDKFKFKLRLSKQKGKSQSTVESKVKVDKEVKDFFEIDDIAHGDEFGAVQPWKGAIKEPTNHPGINPTKPDVTYQMDFVYGYRTEDVRMNLYYNIKR